MNLLLFSTHIDPALAVRSLSADHERFLDTWDLLKFFKEEILSS